MKFRSGLTLPLLIIGALSACAPESTLASAGENGTSSASAVAEASAPETGAGSGAASAAFPSVDSRRLSQAYIEAKNALRKAVLQLLESADNISKDDRVLVNTALDNMKQQGLDHNWGTLSFGYSTRRSLADSFLTFDMAGARTLAERIRLGSAACIV